MRFADKIRNAVRAILARHRPQAGPATAPPSARPPQAKTIPPGPDRHPRRPVTQPRSRPQRDDDLPWAEEIPDLPPADPDVNLPFADELTETEAAIYGGATIHAASSWIEEWKYLGHERQLYILVKGRQKRKQYGRVYRLDSVTFKTAMDFYRSDSPGRFFNRFLKGRYSGAKLGTMPTSRGPNVVMTID